MNSGGADAHGCREPGGNLRERLQFINEFLVLADIVVGAAFGYISVEAYFRLAALTGAPPILPGLVWRELVLVSVIAALVVRRPDAGLRAGQRTAPRTIRAVLQRTVSCLAILGAVGFATGTFHAMARLWLLLWGVAFVLWLCASRVVLLAWERRLLRLGSARETIAVIGSRTLANRLADRLRAEATVISVIETPTGDAANVAKALSGIVALAREGTVGLVVLVLGANQPRDLASRIVEALKAAPVQIAIWAEIDGMPPASDELRIVAGVPLLMMADMPLQPRDRMAKALLDRCGAALLLLLACPMLIAVAATVLVETPGPVLFRQARTGRGGRLFTVYKFRTMRHIPGQGPRAQTRRFDPRCTRVGAFLRRTSLDEMPQLWNVLRGEMSLVGPRPHADALHARERGTGSLMLDYAQRNRVKPGLTGWAQVQGYRGAADTPEKLRRRVELDLFYIENWSFWFDLEILARTPLAVLAADNAF